MLLLVIVSLITLLCIAVLHYSQHFKLEYRGCFFQANGTSILSMSIPARSPDLTTVRTRSVSHNKLRRERPCKQCCCVLKSIDGQTFDFFPVSFLIYIIFLSFLSILIIFIDIINYKNISNDENTVDLLFGYSAKTYHRQSLFALHSIDFTHNKLYVLDLFLIFGIMFLSIWESLFSWYRYYTTYKSAKQMRETETKSVIKKFILYYGLIYSVLFLIEIFMYYYTFLIVVIMHLTFNIMCTWKFSEVLVEQYKLFIMMEIDTKDTSNSRNEQILSSVIFMKRTSIICCILQSISLSIFVIAYNPTVIYYLPILWSISCSIFALNFIRNRIIVKEKILSFIQIIKYKYFTKPVKSMRMHSKAKLPNLSDKKSKSKSNCNNILSEIILNKNNETSKSDNIMITNTGLQLQTAQSNPVNIRSQRHIMMNKLKKNKSDADLFKIGIIDDEKSINIIDDNSDYEIEHSISRKKTPRANKALELLGIKESNSQMSHQINIAHLKKNKSISNLSLRNKISNSLQNGDYLDIHMVETPPMLNEINDIEFNDEKIQEQITEEIRVDEVNIQPIIMTDLVTRDNEQLDTPMKNDMDKPRPSQQDIDEAMKSFKLFAKYGFLSNSGINSAAQVRKYNVKMQTRNSVFNTITLANKQLQLQKEAEMNVSVGGSHSVQSRNKLPEMKNWFTKSNSLPKSSDNNSESNSHKKQVKFAIQ